MRGFKNDPKRKKFIKKDGYYCWECKDYRTFYMTIRKTNLETDIKKGRNPNDYILVTSVPEYFDGFKTPEEAMKKGYKRSDELFEMRLKSKPYKV